jgi:cysteine synthase A
MVCAQKGYPLVVTMADSFSIERRKLMRMLGAKVVLTPRAQKGFGMYQKAVELAKTHGWFLAHQFETPANAEIHEATTAREILADFKGEKLDWFVTGYGTGGTLSGVGRVLRKERPETKIIMCEPANAQLVGSGKAQERAADGSPAGAIRPSSRIRSRAGRRTSSRWCCRRRSTRSTSTSAWRSPAPRASSGRARSRRRKASSAASRAARPSPWR